MRRVAPVLVAGLLSACSTPTVEEGEWLVGGETTNTMLLGGNAFLRPAANLAAAEEQAFYSGNSFFNQAWVEAPASTDRRDGLGPLFNARTCSGCHMRDGKAAPPDDGVGPFVGLLLRLSVPGPDGAPVPDPVYGGQLQDQALPGVPVEALPRVAWSEEPGTLADGTAYSLLRPTWSIEQTGYGPLPDDLMISPRIAPHMIGLGLLEAVPEDWIAALEDPDDDDGDGISGRRQRLPGPGGERTGRFGWKGDAPDVADQSAGAFLGDMGLTSPLRLDPECTEVQTECLSAPHGGEPEVDPDSFDRVVLYSRAVAPPVRRKADDPDVLAGKGLFGQLGCDGCHVPSVTTGEGALDAFSNQLIWPYTDLLLHDMGEDLADGRPVAAASGREWKTPPLWGLGLMQDVSGHTRYLHDGRARSLEEAILWHGGEAEESRVLYTELSSEDRALLLEFLGDL